MGEGLGEERPLSNDVHHANGVVRERGSGHPRGCGRGARAKESRRPRRAGIPRGRARERARERERGRADLGSWFAYILRVSRGLRAARNDVRRRPALDRTRTRTRTVRVRVQLYTYTDATPFALVRQARTEVRKYFRESTFESTKVLSKVSPEVQLHVHVRVGLLRFRAKVQRYVPVNVYLRTVCTVMNPKGSTL